VKTSEFKALLDSLPEGYDPDIVTGEVWLPERLIDTQLDDQLLFLEFDNAPEEDEGEEEGRGFVEHEIELIRQQITTILHQEKGLNVQTEELLSLLVMAHESTSSEFIEMIEPYDTDSDF